MEAWLLKVVSSINAFLADYLLLALLQYIYTYLHSLSLSFFFQSFLYQ